ncbi:MAG: Crp/Fnr family transcriptional regulator [Burkholderiaceae bacterium]
MPAVQNHLIDLLPRRQRARLLALCEPQQLVLGKVLCEPCKATRHVYFPTQGHISLIAGIDAKPGMEVGMVGREGMLGVQLALGVPTVPLHALVQGPGAAWRVGATAFREELARSRALQRVLQRYVYVLLSQLASSSICLRYHQIGPRLARWLLMSQDRAHTRSFPLTQDFLAYMLGVRRVGVTIAAGLLQRQGLITYHHGQLTVLDRAGLRRASCSCYETDRKAYADQLA